MWSGWERRQLQPGTLVRGGFVRKRLVRAEDVVLPWHWPNDARGNDRRDNAPWQAAAWEWRSGRQKERVWQARKTDKHVSTVGLGGSSKLQESRRCAWWVGAKPRRRGIGENRAP
jgi:hypothetical protein